ncbi:hypothetical protein FACS189444_5040 [Spirochaetia bacterium]|nr:hypothetical protein FACS189444_5040 [Spirochaetia bacterium]
MNEPLFTVLAEPLYIRETDLTPEELAIIEAGDKEYRDHPETFTPLSAFM